MYGNVFHVYLHSDLVYSIAISSEGWVYISYTWMNIIIREFSTAPYVKNIRKFCLVIYTSSILQEFHYNIFHSNVIHNGAGMKSVLGVGYIHDICGSILLLENSPQLIM